MQIVCPNCATGYDVQAAALGAEGRSVRCTRCRTVWHAMPAPEPELVAATAAGTAEPQAAEGGPGSEFDWSLGGEEGAKPDASEAGEAAESAAPSEELGQGAV